jgi:RNA ligase (TIGR02306 family)
MDSTYKVPLTTIKDIKEHPNAHSLSLAFIYGFQVIVRKGEYQVGDEVIYIPIDSILPKNLEDFIFPPESKVKLINSRVRQIKLRGLASQGMLISKNVLSDLYGLNPDKYGLEDDLAEAINVTKYEPPYVGVATSPKLIRTRDKPLTNPNFHEYNGLTNIKWVPSIFTNEDVIITEKIHGTNARFGRVKTVPNTFLKKVKRFFGLLPDYEFVYGSNKVELTNRPGHVGFYGNDIYGSVFHDIGARDKVKDGEIIYGEIYGDGIQKNYSYGLKNEHAFVVFDIKVEQEDGKYKWLDPEEVEAICNERGLEYVPVLYRGLYEEAVALNLTFGPSKLNNEQMVREGIVIKKRIGYDSMGNKTSVKWISEDYLADKNNTDFH